MNLKVKKRRESPTPMTDSIPEKVFRGNAHPQDFSHPLEVT
jgi:hypothetical protein